MKINFIPIVFALTICAFQQVESFPHEHTGILNIDVASEFIFSEMQRLFKVLQDPIIKRLADLLYHHEVDNIRDILTVFAAPMSSTPKIPDDLMKDVLSEQPAKNSEEIQESEKETDGNTDDDIKESGDEE
uniref:CSON004165 protein n=1 Tax=Culicoides sonorensis TaxID=179676 RepID=A0A336L7F0_CULSO